MYSLLKFLKTKQSVWSLSFLMLLYSCKTTYSDALFYSSLSNALENDRRVKIETKDNLHLKFKNVVFEDGSFFGIQKFEGVHTKVRIDLMNIRSIRTESKVMLGVANAIIVGIVGVLFIAYVVANIVTDFEDDDEE